MRRLYESIAQLGGAIGYGSRTINIACCRDSILVCKILLANGLIDSYAIKRKMKCNNYSSRSNIEIRFKHGYMENRVLSAALLKSRSSGKRCRKFSRIRRLFEQDFSGVGAFRTSRGILSSKKTYYRGIGGEYLCQFYGI